MQQSLWAMSYLHNALCITPVLLRFKKMRATKKTLLLYWIVSTLKLYCTFLFTSVQKNPKPNDVESCHALHSIQRKHYPGRPSSLQEQVGKCVPQACHRYGQDETPGGWVRPRWVMDEDGCLKRYMIGRQCQQWQQFNGSVIIVW